MSIPPNVPSVPSSDADALSGVGVLITGEDSSVEVIAPTTTNTVVVKSISTTIQDGFEHSDYNAVTHRSDISSPEDEAFGGGDDDEESDGEEEGEMIPGWRFKGRPDPLMKSNPPQTGAGPRTVRSPPANPKPNNTSASNQTKGQQSNGDKKY